MNEKIVPELRFAGFGEPWEKRRLVDISDIVTGTTPPTCDQDNYGGNKLFVSPADIQTNRYVESTITTLTEKGSSLGRGLRPGTSLFVSIGSTIGKVAQIKEYATTNQQINAVIPCSEMNDNFIFTLLEKEADIIKKLSAQQAVPIINKTTFGEIAIKYPSNIEQKKIGDYFENLDTLITLQQRRLDKLKTVKKSLLDKMFPRPGAEVPELRFAGFSEPWERRILSDVTEEFKSGTYIAAEDIEEQGEYPVYGGNGLRGYAKIYNHDGEYALIGRQGALCGNMNYSYGKAYFTEHAVAVKANILSSTKFLFYLLDIMNLGQYSGQSAQPGLAVGKLVKLDNLFPSKQEQDEIGSFFASIDTLITLQQCRLDKLKTIKKALLAKMFV